MEMPVSEEQPADLMVNDERLVTFMCTPEHLKEMALGYLWGAELISSMDEVLVLGVCDDMRIITVQLAGDLPGERLLERVVSSGCGSGGYSADQGILEREVDSDFSIFQGDLRRGFVDMYSQAERYQETGGIHSAALMDHRGVIVVREDVGRHNAVDKVLGACLLRKLDPGSCGIITTGRLSSDMVLKCLAAGIGLVATRSIPTSLAWEIAEGTGLTLVGRAHTRRPLIYCGAHRFLDDRGTGAAETATEDGLCS